MSQIKTRTPVSTPDGGVVATGWMDGWGVPSMDGWMDGWEGAVIHAVPSGFAMVSLTTS